MASWTCFRPFNLCCSAKEMVLGFLGLVIIFVLSVTGRFTETSSRGDRRRFEVFDVSDNRADVSFAARNKGEEETSPWLSRFVVLPIMIKQKFVVLDFCKLWQVGSNEAPAVHAALVWPKVGVGISAVRARHDRNTID